jgi:hypothetical protein
VRAWLAHTSPDYRVGTLAYTRLGLFLIFVWLLWGDLVWSLMQMVFPASMPLQLDRMGVPSQWIGYMMSTAAAMINMTFVPVISFRSDRTRSRWGRRIPYLLVTTPFLCVFLAILGFSDSIGAWIRTSPLPGRVGISPVMMIVIVMGTLILLYDVFNVFVNSIYWYLFRDIVPAAFLGRFMAAFRMIGTLANMIWGSFIYGRIESDTPSIYVGAAVLYFVGFGLMCLMVKEGEYPPPGDVAQAEPWLARTWHAIRTYARECFSHPMFVLFYLSQALFAVGTATIIYKNLFYIRHLHITTAQLGSAMAVMSLPLLLMQMPIGWLVDKFHPMRTYLVSANRADSHLLRRVFPRQLFGVGFCPQRVCDVRRDVRAAADVRPARRVVEDPADGAAVPGQAVRPVLLRQRDGAPLLPHPRQRRVGDAHRRDDHQVRHARQRVCVPVERREPGARRHLPLGRLLHVAPPGRRPLPLRRGRRRAGNLTRERSSAARCRGLSSAAGSYCPAWNSMPPNASDKTSRFFSKTGSFRKFSEAACESHDPPFTPFTIPLSPCG